MFHVTDAGMTADPCMNLPHGSNDTHSLYSISRRHCAPTFPGLLTRVLTGHALIMPGSHGCSMAVDLRIGLIRLALVFA